MSSENGVDAAARDKDYSEFAAAVGSRELSRLEKNQIDYRIPLLGARYFLI